MSPLDVFRRGAIFAAALAAAGCAGFEKATEPESGLVPSAAPRTVGADTASRREHNRILTAYGGAYADPALDILLAGISARISKASDQPDVAYRITVLNSPSINAFALPTGDLYVTRGLLALANDTSEVAAVLAHEMAHVTARHAFARADKERQAVLVSRIVTDVLGDAEAGATTLAKSKIALARFSREQELEADRMGVANLARAGFDPLGSAHFLANMGKNATLRATGFGGASENETIDFMSTHPATPERVEIATRTAQESGRAGQGEHDRGRFLTAVEGMVYGDDPAQGYVRGNRFIHPVIGFSFTAPDNFTLENASESIVGIGPSDTALRLDTVLVPNGQPLGQHLANDLMEGVAISNVEETSINGFPAAIAIAKGRDWSFRIAGIRFGSNVYRIVYAAKNLTPEQDLIFRSSILSFRRLTSSESTEVRPQRLAVVTVKPGDSILSLAERMAVPNRNIERFQVLNGLGPEQNLKAGDRVKLIVE
ncbi:metalloprotease [Terrihabitans soli]|uniref:Metalloprotease n=1 Tax=Terrihabitans soli TaxID=708113 RepID=A0A6S6QRS5_9HYPH|nr:M48 family metalloprotease [Terrihabitans soli]BCJ89590.1 metalloprotease [Terrihabitans soli]